MKYAAITLFLLAGFALAEDEAKAPDATKLLTDLQVANAAKNAGDVGILLDDIIGAAQSNKDTKLAEVFSGELAKSLKVCKGNWGQLKKIVRALGEFRAKKGASSLKRLAFQKKAKSEDHEELQAAAIDAIAMARNPKYINGIADMCKHKSKHIAKAAYTAFRHYGPAKGKVRRKVAEILMKRLDMEYPSSGGQNSAGVSAEKQERWQELSPIIVETMQSICRMTTITDIETWREWWKENGKKPSTWRDKKA